MFGDEFLARGLDSDVPCELPLGPGQRCGRPAGWLVPVGRGKLPCCPFHMEQALQMYRANKVQQQMFQRKMEEIAPKPQKSRKEDTPTTESFRRDILPRLRKRKPKP